MTMAKNKQKGQKKQNVFQVATKPMKIKNKTKPVSTSLKHMNAVKNEKVDSLNKMFTDIQREVKSISKCSVVKESKMIAQVPKDVPCEEVNVDGAAQLFSQL